MRLLSAQVPRPKSRLSVGLRTEREPFGVDDNGADQASRRSWSQLYGTGPGRTKSDHRGSAAWARPRRERTADSSQSRGRHPSGATSRDAGHSTGLALVGSGTSDNRGLGDGLAQHESGRDDLTGIGRTTALAFANDGARLVVSGRNDVAGELLVKELEAAGGAAEFVRADVRFDDDPRHLVDRAVDRWCPGSRRPRCSIA
ncbi:SDR family oxidoreductase [Asanoa sp. NPDC049573]|uniref:SDR family oxidoreductase n=1 Tax=Asanoa sp. NPDC049573 TaxID=3155396 RepID=UPI00343C1048